MEREKEGGRRGRTKIWPLIGKSEAQRLCALASTLLRIGLVALLITCICIIPMLGTPFMVGKIQALQSDIVNVQDLDSSLDAEKMQWSSESVGTFKASAL